MEGQLEIGRHRMNEAKNEIVVYQPDGTVRLEVRLGQESIWLTQTKIAELFGVQKAAVSKHLKKIFGSGELLRAATVSKMETIGMEGGRTVSRVQEFFNLDAIIAVGYRVNSLRATQFRIWATGVLKEYLLRGYAVNRRLELLEDKVDRRFREHGERIENLEGKVEFFVQTSTPPVCGVFYDGQVWDACSFVEKLIGRAKSGLLLIDNWVGPGTLDLLAKKRKDVRAEIITSTRGNTLAASDIAKFNAQYPKLDVRYCEAFHDRFLIIDDRELYLVGASLKDLGRKCFGFTKMDAGEIRRIKKAAFSGGTVG